jgi:integrase
LSPTCRQAASFTYEFMATVASTSIGPTWLGPVNFHQLRHSTASLLIADGATVLDVCAYLGHSSPTVTLEVYGHLFKGSGQKLAASMEARRSEWRDRMKQRAT